MNADQTKNINQLLEQIERVNIESKIAEQFRDKDLGGMAWNDITGVQLPELTSRVVVQMRAEIESGDTRFYPDIFPAEIAGQYQNRDVIQLFREFLNTIQNNNWPQATFLLKGLIAYQIFCGFWDRSAKRLHSIPKLRRLEIMKNFELRQEQVDKLAGDAKQALSGLQEALGTIKATKDEVTQLLATIRKSAEEATTSASQAKGHESTLIQMTSTQAQNIAQTEQHLKMATEGLNACTLKANELAAMLKDGEAKIAYLKEKEAIVNEIAGTAAAGILGQKFEARKRELTKPVIFWLVGIVIATVASGAWVWWTHKTFQIQGASIWMELASNFGLLLPAVFLLLFATAQYLKERHFQEEYAFRASVAMTLKAFADEIKSSGDKDRNEMLRETVAKLYQLPSGLVAKEERSGLFAFRAAKGVLHETTELVKEVKK